MTFTKEDWKTAELQLDPQGLFVVWAIKESFCRTTDDFQRHFGQELPIDELIAQLEHDGFVGQHEGLFCLTKEGRLAASTLDEFVRVPSPRMALGIAGHKLPSETLAQVDWENLVSRIKEQLHGHVATTEVDDLAQDVVLTVFQNAEHFDPSKAEGESFEQAILSWVSGITKYKRAQYIKEKRRKREHLEAVVDRTRDALADESYDAKSAELEQALGLVRKALEECSPSLLEIARLYFEGQSPDEMSKELGLTKDAVYTRLARLRKKLRSKLRQSDEFTPQVVFAPSINLFQAINKSVWGEEESIENYNRLVDELQVDSFTKEQLKKARTVIDSDEVGLTKDDRMYVTGELYHLTLELQRSSPRSSMIKRFWKHIEEVASSVASTISAAQTLSKIIGS